MLPQKGSSKSCAAIGKRNAKKKAKHKKMIRALDDMRHEEEMT
jgi:hypothetical protein